MVGLVAALAVAGCPGASHREPEAPDPVLPGPGAFPPSALSFLERPGPDSGAGGGATTTPWQHAYRIGVRSLAAGRVDRAVAWLDDAVARGGDAEVLATLAGALLHRARERDTALDLLRAAVAADRAAELGPEAPAAAYNAAVARTLLELRLTAGAAWERFRDLAPDGVPGGDLEWWTGRLAEPRAEDRFLQRVPYTALWDGRSGSFLVERHAVSVSPSATLFLRSRRGRDAPGRSRFLGVAGATGPTSEHPLLDRLGQVEAELSASANHYRQVRIVRSPEEVAAALVEPPDLLHFAGHAWLDPIDVERSQLLFDPTGTQGGTGSLRLADLRTLRRRNHHE